MFNLLKKYKRPREDVYEIPESDAELKLSVRRRAQLFQRDSPRLRNTRALELLRYRSAFHPAPKGGELSCFKNIVMYHVNHSSAKHAKTNGIDHVRCNKRPFSQPKRIRR